MSIVDVLDDVPSNKFTDQLVNVAAEYGLVCFKIQLLIDRSVELPYKLIESKQELENKLKQSLYV